MLNFNPYSKNLVFLDTEFSSLDPRRGEILSIGLVKMSGDELYLELEVDENCVDEWQKENILPTLTEAKVGQGEAIKRMGKFVGDTKPYALAYVNQFDMIYLYKIIDQQAMPFFWLPLDFASVLFALGYDPAIMTKRNPALLDELGLDINNYREHHALDDARLLRQVYLKILEKNV